MKRITVLLCTLVFLAGAAAYAADDHDKGGGGGGESFHASTARPTVRVRTSRPAQARQPVVIHMNHSGNSGQYQPGRQPSYGQTQWTHTTQARQKTAQPSSLFRQPAAARVPGVRSATAVHHHTYTQGYVRKKLSKIGVKSEPSYITDRSEIVSTDRAHSMIGNPSTGPKGEAFKASMVSPRKFNSPVVRNQMAIVSRPAYMAQIDRENVDETQRNHVYWHGAEGSSYSYAHYMDNWGYHWYGWYAGDQFFWTRNYNGRWWWYDSGYNRWCFYNDNYWWWQDPYHVGELYAYNDDSYIPANSADDQVVVTGQEQTTDMAYNSPDGMRTVKIAQGDGDAFLYDTANPPTFDPVYMASGVQSVQFSDTNNGRPLEIILKLNDGSYDMFNAEGNPYNYETSDSD
jgi:hypothetical protein